MRGGGGTVQGKRGTEGAEWLHYVSGAEWTAGRGSPRTLAFRGLVRRGGRPQHRGHKIAEGQWRGKGGRNTGNPPATNTNHDAPPRTTTAHYYTQRQHHHQQQPDTTICQHHNMTRHSATHCDAPHNTTATRGTVPQDSTRQTPALPNNGTQHATPQPNGSHTTPHNTAQCYTVRPTTKTT